jgi:subtilase family protein
VRAGGRAQKAALATLALALLVAAPALGAFPGSPPTAPPGAITTQESPRANAPNDPDFDPCEPMSADNPDGGSCSSYWSEQFGLFGFRPDSAKDILMQPLQYPDCSQLDDQGKDANQKKGDPQCSQISGVRADSAWKFSAGSPDVAVAILDTGIRWQDRELVNQIHLNRDELPKPDHSLADVDALAPLPAGKHCNQFTDDYDANGDGAFNVADYACDHNLTKAAGDDEADSILDGSDLIATFSNHDDADHNGYVDDIAGWDYFNDDNDPQDASSCCSAGGHGTARAKGAAAQTNNADNGAGLCPRCQIMPLRVWDTFVVDSNLYSLGVVYAANNGASVVEGAVGGLLNSSFARRAFHYADQKGLALMLVSSDINSANHNYPTNYNEAMYVAGSLPDTAPAENCELGGVPGLPSGSLPGCAEFLDFLDSSAGLTPSTQPSTTSFFRNSNLTQYGGKADIVLVGSTGSENTGQAAGAAGLLASYGRQMFGGQATFPKTLSGNEIRQLLTMTAEDVLPANTGTIGEPDKANKGWDPHFGYGRVNLAGAMRMIQAGQIPPEVQLNSPDWWAPLDVDKIGAAGVPVTGHVAGPHIDGTVEWRLDYACGQDAQDSNFQQLTDWTQGPVDGQVGTLSKSLLNNLADNCNGSVVNDAGRPAGNPNQGAVPWPQNPYPEPDPERHAFQIRLTAREVADHANIGRYRKTLFAYRDDGTLSGWPQPIGPSADAGNYITGGGGEAAPRLYDMNGDNQLDVVLATSSGEIQVLDHSGQPLPSWNGGNPVKTEPYAAAIAHASADLPGDPPLEPPRTPAIGDITGDGEPEVVVTAGEHIYAWHKDGTPVDGFPVRLDPSLSEPCDVGVTPPCFHPAERAITTDRHVKRGFSSSPALADLDGDGKLDIVAGALDQHVYAFDGQGHAKPGFPALLDADVGTHDPPDSSGAEIVTSPAIARDADGKPMIVISTNEVQGAHNDDFDPLNFLSLFVGNATGTNFTYALHGDGTAVSGWPVQTGVLSGDILPLVVPGEDAAAGNLDDIQPGDEVSVSAATGDAKLVSSGGTVLHTYSNSPGADSGLVDKATELNIANYPSIGRLIDAEGPSVFKGGLSLGGAANLLAVNQNLPFNHAVQAWNPLTGSYRPGFPVATDDFQLLSQPAIAQVGGTLGRQALVGTGLYQLHAYGELGQEPSGWPKFTGGWIFSTPSVGDIDGDGKLDVMTATREGWAFVWKTDVDACSQGGSTTNDEWWTLHHDEQGTANYGTDARPPGVPRGLEASVSGDQVGLSWVAPGDDLLCGTADRYRVVAADHAISGPDDGTVVGDFDKSQGARSASLRAAGGNEVRVVKIPGGTTHVAVIYRDEKDNWGDPADVDLSKAGRGGGSAIDRVAPTVTVRAPRYASDSSSSRRFRIRWRGRDPDGVVASYTVQVARLGRARAARFRTLRRSTARTSLRFRGKAGVTYEFRVRARDRAGHDSAYARAWTVTPLDDRLRRVRYSRGWRLAERRRAYGRRVHRAVLLGASLRLRFRGRRIAVIGTRLRHGGRLRIRVDRRRARTVSLRGRRTRYRRVLFRSPRLGRRRHVIRIRVLGGRAEIDAFGIDSR